MNSSPQFRIAVLISGSGTTLRNLIERHRDGRLLAEIAVVGSSNAKAAGLEFANAAGIPTFVVSHRQFADIQHFSEVVFEKCRMAHVDLIVLAGFLKRLVIPDDFVQRVINIHPSLIPDFCGAGFYGRHVHEAVISSGRRETGCTVHFVDDQYDHGPIIAQRRVRVLPDDTPATLATRVFEQECELYPEVINHFASGGNPPFALEKRNHFPL